MHQNLKWGEKRHRGKAMQFISDDRYWKIGAVKQGHSQQYFSKRRFQWGGGGGGAVRWQICATNESKAPQLRPLIWCFYPKSKCLQSALPLPLLLMHGSFPANVQLFLAYSICCVRFWYHHDAITFSWTLQNFLFINTTCKLIYKQNLLAQEKLPNK